MRSGINKRVVQTRVQAPKGRMRVWTTRVLILNEYIPLDVVLAFIISLHTFLRRKTCQNHVGLQSKSSPCTAELSGRDVMSVFSRFLHHSDLSFTIYINIIYIYRPVIF